MRKMATILRRLEQRRDERSHFADKLATLRAAGLLAVAGEEALLAAVDDKMRQTDGILVNLERNEVTVEQALKNLDAVAQGYEWRVIEGVQPDLDRKIAEQNNVLLHLQSQVDGWKTRLEPVRASIDEALTVRAPVARERAVVERMAGLVAAAERALSDRRYLDAYEPLRRLEPSSATPASEEEPPQPRASVPTPDESPEGVAQRVRAKVAATQRFSGRAEVLLLHSAAEGLHTYTVLLRTPSEVGTQGFSIQDSSSLVDQDRAYMRDAISRITKAVDSAIARSFRPATESVGARSATVAAPVVPAAAAIRDLRPQSPSGEDATPDDLSTLVRDMGKVMFRLIAPDRMREYLSNNPCSLTITTDDLELPWELMYDESLEGPASEAGLGFLCLQRPIARMPMGRAFPRQRPVARRTDKLRFLLIHSDPDRNLMAAGSEVQKIKESLTSDQVGRENVDVTVLGPDDITGEALNRALLGGRYDVIHFAGHASFDEANPELSGLILKNHERFLSQKIQRFLEGQPLVFLNACQTGRTANSDAPQSVGEYFWRPAEGLASAFLYGGALGCVGSLWPVYDDPAAEFAIEFYKQALEGQMLGEAMRTARRVTRERYSDSITWASFVLYGDPTYRLVR